MNEDQGHGEVVGFGVLALLALDGQDDMLRTMIDFNRSIGLPTRLEDIEVTLADLDRVIPKVLRMPDIEHYPYRVTQQALRAAFERLEAEA